MGLQYKLSAVPRTHKRLAQLFPLLVVAILAIFVRLYKLRGGFGFFTDQGHDLLVIHDWFNSGKIPLLGPLTSIGTFHMGPLYYYLIAPFVFFAHLDPIGPVYVCFIGGILLLIVGFLWLSTFDRSTALIFLLLGSISPRLIFLSRGSWSNNLQPLVTLLFVYAFFKFISTNRLIFILLCGVFIGIGVQFHYLFLVNVIPAVLILFILKRKSLSFRNLFIVASGIFIPLIPFFIAQVHSGFPDIKGMLMYLSGQNHNFSLPSFGALIQTFSYPFTLYLPYFQPTFRPNGGFDMVHFFSIAMLITAFIFAPVAKPLKVATLFFFTSGVFQIYALNIPRLPHYFDSLGWWTMIMLSAVISTTIARKSTAIIGVALFIFFVAQSLFSLPGQYQISRSLQVAQWATQIIAADVVKSGAPQPIKIFAVSPLTSSAGFEFQYLLLLSSIKTTAAQNADSANYVIVEEDEEPYIPTAPRFVLLSTTHVRDTSTMVKSIKIYRNL